MVLLRTWICCQIFLKFNSSDPFEELVEFTGNPKMVGFVMIKKLEKSFFTVILYIFAIIYYIHCIFVTLFLGNLLLVAKSCVDIQYVFVLLLMFFSQPF